jgi:pimeloyl-ACP methyl ester carboxylesterase
MSTIDYNGHKVWYEESGQGEPLLFLHNGGNDHRIWDRQVAHFSRNYRVIAVDHLGHGNSDRPAVDYTLPLFSGEVAALVEQLSLAPVTLIGHCIGAAMSLDYTLSHPENVRRLVLFNVATEKTLLAGPLADVYRNFSRDPAAREAFIAAMEQNGLPREQTEGGLQLQLGGTRAADDPEFADYIHRLYTQPGQMRTLYNNLSQFGSFAVLDEFARPANFPPVLLFWGGSNQVLPASAGEEVRDRLKPERCEFLEDCGHLTMRERPAEINQKIEAFLQATAPEAAHAQ